MSNGSGMRGWGTALLRIIVGVVFLMHGAQKFSMGFGNVSEFLGSLHIPVPFVAAILLTLVEFLGGISLIVGLLTRYVASLLAIDMLVALITFHVKNGFFADKAGVEFPLVLLAACINLIFAGAGALGVDTLRKKSGSTV